MHLQTFSIRAPSTAELNDEVIRTEAEATYTVLRRPTSELFAAHLGFLFSRPVAYFRMLVLALRHRPPGLRSLFLSVAHFAEAALLARELKHRAIDRLHNHFANSAATVGYLASRLLGIPWSFTMHGISETDYPAGLMLGRKIEAASFRRLRVLFRACSSHEAGSAKALEQASHHPVRLAAREVAAAGCPGQRKHQNCLRRASLAGEGPSRTSAGVRFTRSGNAGPSPRLGRRWARRRRACKPRRSPRLEYPGDLRRPSWRSRHAGRDRVFRHPCLAQLHGRAAYRSDGSNGDWDGCNRQPGRRDSRAGGRQ